MNDTGYDTTRRYALAILAHGALIAEEVLALTLEATDAPTGDASVEAEIDGVAVTFALRKA